jgi:glycosyltransferase involved in cell wall biosynthesis
MLSIAQFLNELAHYEDVTLLSLDSQQQFSDYLQNTIDIKLHNNLNAIPISNKKFGFKSNRLFFTSNALATIKKLFSNDEIIIYTRDFKQMREFLKLKKHFNKVKFIFEVHQVLSQNHCRSGLYKKAYEIKKLEEYVFNHVDALVCITDLLSKEIIKVFPEATKQHLILPVGFSENFLKIDPQYKKTYDLIYSGNFSKWKGIENLIYSLAIVTQTYPGFKSILVGANDDEYQYYSKLIAQKNLTDNITLLKRIPHKEIIHLVEQSKIGVLSNTYEGDALLFTSPLKLYEYLGSGIRIVASRLPSLEHAIDNQYIYWAKPNDVSSLASSIQDAYTDQNHDAAKQKVYAKSFTWRKRAERFSQFIKEIV